MPPLVDSNVPIFSIQKGHPWHEEAIEALEFYLASDDIGRRTVPAVTPKTSTHKIQRYKLAGDCFCVIRERVNRIARFCFKLSHYPVGRVGVKDANFLRARREVVAQPLNVQNRPIEQHVRQRFRLAHPTQLFALHRHLRGQTAKLSHNLFL